MLSRRKEATEVMTTDPMLFTCGMSRSGTTLLATVLDSHSQISMAYELIPPPLPGPAALLDLLSSAGNSFDGCRNLLKKIGRKDERLFFKRCQRAGISEEDVCKALQELHDSGLMEIRTLEDRLAVAWRIARKKRDQERTQLYGFKLNMPSVAQAHKLFPGGHYVFILRDPRDVVASHRKRKFRRSTEQICQAWNNYLDSFLAFQGRYPEVAVLIRYEDLVTKPHETIERLFRKLSVELEDSVFTFYRSKATVHRTGHPNAESLRQSFFTTSVGRWREELDVDSIGEVERLCGNRMAIWKYA